MTTVLGEIWLWPVLALGLVVGLASFVFVFRGASRGGVTGAEGAVVRFCLLGLRIRVGGSWGVSGRAGRGGVGIGGRGWFGGGVG